MLRVLLTVSSLLLSGLVYGQEYYWIQSSTAVNWSTARITLPGFSVNSYITIPAETMSHFWFRQRGDIMKTGDYSVLDSCIWNSYVSPPDGETYTFSFSYTYAGQPMAPGQPYLPWIDFVALTSVSNSRGVILEGEQPPAFQWFKAFTDASCDPAYEVAYWNRYSTDQREHEFLYLITGGF